MKYVIIAALILSGCYTRPRAVSQFAKASIAYPDIPADYCARVYPPKTNVIKGDTVTTFDTIYTGGEIFMDTLVVKDTVRIIKTIQLPGTRIIERITITDTLQIENTARYDLCEIERRDAVLGAKEDRADRDKWRRIAKSRFWIIAGMGAAMALGIFMSFKRRKP